MRPDDIERIRTLRGLTWRGELLLAECKRPDLARNTDIGGLFRIAGDGSVSPWSAGDRDSHPSISPDGRWVAFLRPDDAAHPQLWVMPATGGEARRCTDLPLGAGAPVWAPDARRVAFVARDPAPGRHGRPERAGDRPVPADEEAPRRISRPDYRADDIGFVCDRRPVLYVVDVGGVGGIETGEGGAGPVPLTDGRCEVSDPAWTADGAALLVVAAESWGVRETVRNTLYRVPCGGGAPAPVLDSPGEVARPVVAGDGTLLYYAKEFPGWQAVARNTGLWASAPDGAGGWLPPRRMTDVDTVDCVAAAGPPVVVGSDVLVVVRNRGAAELRRVPLSARDAVLDKLPVVAGERATVGAFAVDGGRIAAVVSTAGSAGEVVLAADGGTRTVTDFAGPLRESGLRPVHDIHATAADGYPVHGFVVLPEGQGPHPVLLCLHGGPFSAHGYGFFDEAQVYASAGYAVVLPNPRGSAGYGEAHGRALVGAFGTVDVADVLALLDAALELPGCDRARVGVMGGSYGGLLTTWLAAHHGDRFRAAWSERAVNDWVSFAGTSDIGWWFADAYCGADVERQRAMSPLSYADRIAIPVAVVHSERDWRCPLEQAQRLFVALWRNRVPAELLVFPGEGHELSRSGRPVHRRQRFDAVLSWWERHLRRAS